MSLVETERHSSVNTAHCRVIKLESSPAPFSLVTHSSTVPAVDHKPLDFHLHANFMLSASHCYTPRSARAFGIMSDIFSKKQSHCIYIVPYVPGYWPMYSLRPRSESHCMYLCTVSTVTCHPIFPVLLFSMKD